MIKRCSIKAKFFIMILVIIAPFVLSRILYACVSFHSLDIMRIYQSDSLILRAYHRRLTIELVVVGFITLLTLALAYALGNCFLKPILDLQKAAKNMIEGEYSDRIVIYNDDEIGLMAEAFNKMADTIETHNRIHKNFFTHIFHESKTPLNVIFSSVQLIDSYKDNLNYEQYKGKVSKQMCIIRQNCFRIMRLTNNLIDINRHDNGFLRTKLDNYDIVKLIRDVTLSVKKYTESRGINLEFESSLNSKITAFDPDMIERIILNLISNAIKFTDKDGLINVKLAEKNNNIILSVSDTGMGIPEKNLNQIFELFKQVDGYTSRNKEGSGIGLYLVKAFVEAHNGTIQASSVESVGTTFEIAIPIRVLDKETCSTSNKLSGKCELPSKSEKLVSRINIEFSDIYSCCDVVNHNNIL